LAVIKTSGSRPMIKKCLALLNTVFRVSSAGWGENRCPDTPPVMLANPLTAKIINKLTPKFMFIA
jgi:hypothetical protein